MTLSRLRLADVDVDDDEHDEHDVDGDKSQVESGFRIVEFPLN
jgi:hypothetical protein